MPTQLAGDFEQPMRWPSNHGYQTSQSSTNFHQHSHRPGPWPLASGAGRSAPLLPHEQPKPGRTPAARYATLPRSAF